MIFKSPVMDKKNLFAQAYGTLQTKIFGDFWVLQIELKFSYLI